MILARVKFLTAPTTALPIGQRPSRNRPQRQRRQDRHVWPPRVVRGGARQAAIASAVDQIVKRPRCRRLASQAPPNSSPCAFVGMRWRRSALALNGTAGSPDQEGLLPSYPSAPRPQQPFHATLPQQATRLAQPQEMCPVTSAGQVVDDGRKSNAAANASIVRYRVKYIPKLPQKSDRVSWHSRLLQRVSRNVPDWHLRHRAASLEPTGEPHNPPIAKRGVDCDTLLSLPAGTD
jgi:hypothetical protein